jgi:hypothetical protein
MEIGTLSEAAEQLQKSGTLSQKIYAKVAPLVEIIRARILLSSVFGPNARDDEFGSRSINPMELDDGHGPALAGGRGDYCCEYRDSPGIVLSQLSSAAAIPKISHGNRNRSLASALPD